MCTKKVLLLESYIFGSGSTADSGGGFANCRHRLGRYGLTAGAQVMTMFECRHFRGAMVGFWHTWSGSDKLWRHLYETDQTLVLATSGGVATIR
jgi:hypothetical protein